MPTQPNTADLTLDIAEAIFDAIADGQVHAFGTLRRKLPGNRWRQAEVLCGLTAAGAVVATKVGDDTFIELPWPTAAVA